MVIFRDKSGILLSEYLSCGPTISGPSYASIKEGLDCAILEKRRNKVSGGVVLVDGNAPIDKCNIAQTAIEKRMASSN